MNESNEPLKPWSFWLNQSQPRRRPRWGQTVQNQSESSLHNADDASWKCAVAPGRIPHLDLSHGISGYSPVKVSAGYLLFGSIRNFPFSTLLLPAEPGGRTRKNKTAVKVWGEAWLIGWDPQWFLSPQHSQRHAQTPPEPPTKAVKKQRRPSWNNVTGNADVKKKNKKTPRLSLI